MIPFRLIGLSLLLLGTVGCASVKLDAGFSEVKQAVERRAGATVVWSPGTDLERESANHVQRLLQEKLTADAAVQVALLNNRNLQAMYSELGIARAELVQAGLFKNPVIDAAILFPVSGARPDLQL